MLREMIGDAITHFQGASFHGRRILDLVLMAKEVVDDARSMREEGNGI